MADHEGTKREPLRADEQATALAGLPAGNKSARWRWLLGGMGVVFAVALFFAWRYYSVRETTDDAHIEGHIHPIGARVAGTVVQVRFGNNQYVEAGSVLIELDPKDYQLAVDRAKADLAEAEAMVRVSQAQIAITSQDTSSQLSDAQAAVSEAQARITVARGKAQAAHTKLELARARLREAQANAEQAAKDLDRWKPLIEKEEISQQQYDAAVAAADRYRAAADAAQAEVSDAELGIQITAHDVQTEQAKLAQAEASVRMAGTGPQQVAQTQVRAESARANWERAKAALAQAELNLQYTTIRAPVSGVTSKKSVEVGQIIQAGQPLFALVSLDDIWVMANFKETQLRDMRPGQKVTVAVDAYGTEYDAHVDSMAAATGAKFSLLPPENASGNFVKVVQRVPVRIVLEKGQDREHLLRPGMSVVPTVFVR